MVRVSRTEVSIKYNQMDTHQDQYSSCIETDVLHSLNRKRYQVHVLESNFDHSLHLYVRHKFDGAAMVLSICDTHTHT